MVCISKKLYVWWRDLNHHHGGLSVNFHLWASQFTHPELLEWGGGWGCWRENALYHQKPTTPSLPLRHLWSFSRLLWNGKRGNNQTFGGLLITFLNWITGLNWPYFLETLNAMVATSWRGLMEVRWSTGSGPSHGGSGRSLNLPVVTSPFRKFVIGLDLDSNWQAPQRTVTIFISLSNLPS